MASLGILACTPEDDACLLCLKGSFFLFPLSSDELALSYIKTLERSLASNFPSAFLWLSPGTGTSHADLEGGDLKPEHKGAKDSHDPNRRRPCCRAFWRNACGVLRTAGTCTNDRGSQRPVFCAAARSAAESPWMLFGLGAPLFKKPVSSMFRLVATFIVERRAARGSRLAWRPGAKAAGAKAAAEAIDKSRTTLDLNILLAWP